MRTREAVAGTAQAPDGPTKLSLHSRVAHAVGANDATLALRQLLRIELEIRNCQSVSELLTLVASELPRLTGARQAFLFDLPPKRPRLVRTNATTSVDQQSPTVRWLEHQVSILKNKSASQSVVLSATQNASEAGSFPFHFGYWLPLRYRNAELTYGALIVAERSFEPEQVTVAARLVDTAAHALPVLRMRPPSRATAWKRIALLAALVGSMLALLTPFPMTALAPMEIVASEPFVIAAPIDGVVEEVVVPPNAAVSAGTPIVRYVDAIPRNQMLIAERELGLAEAKVRQVQQAAFTDDRAKRDLAQVRAELALKQSELDLARETFEKAVVRAPRDGVVIYSDRKDWVGRPVTTGQRILEIADPTRVEIRAFLPSVDILDLKPGAKTKVFLDGAPLQPLDAQVVSVSHVAKMVEGFGLAYRVQAVVNSGQPSPRIGVRGTAQLFSEKAPLGYYLFRRPLGWLRQKVGL